jgi:DNA polymerase-3 subunit epsilon
MRRHRAALWCACFGFAAACAAALLLWLDVSLDPEARGVLRRALFERRGGLLLLAAFAFAAAGLLAHRLARAAERRARRIAEATRLIAAGNPSHRVEAQRAGELRDVANAINLLAAGYESALNDVEARIARARLELERERNRLAALMSEIGQAVIVCNAEGRILLYNERARRIFSGRGADSREAGFIGLGRSLYSLLERELVAHALEQLQLRLAHGEAAPVAAFIAGLPGGGLARAEIAPVPAPAPDGKAAPGAEAGFVLLLEDVGEEVLRAERSARSLHRYAEEARAALAAVRAAAETLLDHPEMPAEPRRRFTEIVGEGAARLASSLEEFSRHLAGNGAPWLPERVRAGTLLAALRRRIESRTGSSVQTEDTDCTLWLDADSFALAQAASALARRLRDERGVRSIVLQARREPPHLKIALAWSGERLDSDQALAWENAPLSAAGESSALSLREVVERHGGAVWYEFDPKTQRSVFSMLLPAAEAVEAESGVAPASRPLFYDFDLLHRSAETRELDEQSLATLSYTVFDTETTGLDPSAGDEIVAIGAVRIVNGRLLAEERFESLVDPGRPVPAAAARIHGLRTEMLKGQPRIEEVLAAFHRFCEDTVLVGHNVAFDLRFVQLKEGRAGVRFLQPVLDTLLLADVLQQTLAPHPLEALAERFGVGTAGRHTALGDARIAAEIFLRMIPLLRERGIVTLGEARAACERSAYARLRY